MLSPSARTGSRIQPNVTMHTTASTAMRTVVRLGFWPKTMRRAVLTFTFSIIARGSSRQRDSAPDRVRRDQATRALPYRDVDGVLIVSQAVHEEASVVADAFEP